MSAGITDKEEYLINTLLSKNYFDCVISSVYKNYPDSNIIHFMGWNKLLTPDEQKVIDSVAKHTGHFIVKSTYSAYSDELLKILKNENNDSIPECVYLVGFDIDCCVLATAIDLFEHGIRPIVLTKYCGASGGEEAKHAGIRVLTSLIGKNNIFSDLIETKKDLDIIFDRAKNSSHISSFSSEKKAVQLVDKLIKLNWHIAFAESCTGGKAAAGIVDVPSASKVFNCSYVTYANDAKVEVLNVSLESIEKYGVVSEQVALEMAIGVAKKTGSQVGVGISGIAGPGGATHTKPIGVVCFGFFINGREYTQTVQFGNIGRNNVRQARVDFVYDATNKILSTNNEIFL
jgi:nicotinamide-nucleotide amidase